MITQSDREKADKHAAKMWEGGSRPFAGAKEYSRLDYLAGAEAKDLEWQAKVQRLVSLTQKYLNAAPVDGWHFSDCDAAEDNYEDEIPCSCGVGVIQDELQQALTQFTSGQPAKGMVDNNFFLNVIHQWKAFWMNQKQNDVADFENYFNRAFGVDANMKHDLADRLTKAIKGIGKDGG